MIRPFRCSDTENIFHKKHSRLFQSVEKTALRKLLQLDNAETLLDLRSPGNALEALTGDRDGQHSIRINVQYRLCFVWKDGGADNVEIVDYH